MTRGFAFCIGGLAAVVALAASGPASAGPPFITDDPEPVDYGHWEVYGFSAGAHGQGDTNGLGRASKSIMARSPIFSCM